MLEALVMKNPSTESDRRKQEEIASLSEQI